MNPAQLQAALDRVDLNSIDAQQVAAMFRSQPDELLLSAIEWLYTAYLIAHSGDPLHKPSAEAFHDSAVHTIAVALKVRDSYTYARTDEDRPDAVCPAGIEGYAVGRRTR